MRWHRQTVTSNCLFLQADILPLALDRNAVVPADVQVVEGHVFVNEKELTGEDVAIPKIVGSSVKVKPLGEW